MKKAILTTALGATLALGLVGCAGAATEAGGEAEARSLMEGMFNQRFDNFTCEAVVDMEVDAGATSQDVSVDTFLLMDSSSGEPRLLMSIESDPPSAQTDMAMHLVGTEAVVERGDEASVVEVDEAYAAQLAESTGGSAQAQAIYEAAQSIELAQEGGQRVVRIVADPAALTAAGAFSQLAEVTSCEASYVFDDEGRIVRCEIEVAGPSADAAGAMLAISMITDYSDYGTTVVPDLE